MFESTLSTELVQHNRQRNIINQSNVSHTYVSYGFVPALRFEKSSPLIALTHSLFCATSFFITHKKGLKTIPLFGLFLDTWALIQHDSSVYFLLNEVDERLGWSRMGLHGVRRSGWTQSFRTRHSQVGEATFH